MENSKIAWTENTFNPWIGCTKVSPGCANCYAEAQNRLRKWNGGSWGPGSPRRVTSAENWMKPLQWDRKAAAAGKRTKVFCASLADVFDNEAPAGAREHLWDLIRRTSNLDWLILSKRPENFETYLPSDWGQGFSNVWLGVTCEDRLHGIPRVDILRRTPAKVRFLSCEPLLEDVSSVDLTDIDWVIVGGESGHHSREFQIEWARALKGCCAEAEVNFFMKQLGSAPTEDAARFKLLHGNSKGGKDTHGANLLNFPEDLQFQEWPTPITAVNSPQLTTNNSEKTDKERSRPERLFVMPGVDTSAATSNGRRNPESLNVKESQRTMEWLALNVNVPGAVGYLATSAQASLDGLLHLLHSARDKDCGVE